jgi:hypothetical protein
MMNTRDARIQAAIHSGVGLGRAAEEAAEAKTLGFDSDHVQMLIGLLEAQISSRTQMIHALEAHLRSGKLLAGRSSTLKQGE